MRLSFAVVVVGAALAVACLGGCHSPTLVVSPEPASLANLTVAVDVVGVSETDAKEIEGVDPAKWFAGSGHDSDLRKKYRDMTERFELTAGVRKPVQIAPSEKIYGVWKSAGARRVFVIANPPPGDSGKASSWMRSVTIENGKWKDDQVTIWVKREGLSLDKSPKE